MEIAELIRAQSTSLTAAERRVAEAILASPQAVGFGTVADLASAAGVGAASVVRLASKLGFDGFSDLQACVQRDLVSQLRPAAERIRENSASGRDSHAAIELSNVQATLDGVDEIALRELTLRLSDLERPVWVLSGEDTIGVATQFVAQLEQLRPEVALLIGSEVAVRRELALLSERSTVLVIDVRRYEQWVLDAHDMVRRRRVWSAGFTDSVLSPVAARSDVTFVLSAGSTGPFDSHVGTLALLNLIAVRVADELRAFAADRLSAIEAAWNATGALVDGS